MQQKSHTHNITQDKW